MTTKICGTFGCTKDAVYRINTHDGLRVSCEECKPASATVVAEL